MADSAGGTLRDIGNTGEESYGVFLAIRGHRELLPEERHVLKRHWNSLAAGGWGYKFRNRGIKMEDGELHVGFRSSGTEYCILEE